MKIVEDDEPRPVEFVGAGGYGVPLPFTNSSRRPPEPPAPDPPRRRWWWLVSTGVPVLLLVTLYLSARTTTAPSAQPETPPEVKKALIDAGLAAQSEALLGGDLAAYLRFVDAPLHAEFTQRFHSLRALRVGRWSATVTRMPLDLDDEANIDVGVGYCLGDKDCVPVKMVLSSRWTVRDGRAVATTFQRTTLPWDVTPLEGVTGRRVIVAGPASVAGQLPQIVAAADQAAEVADRYARWEPPPKRYVVYVAADEQVGYWWIDEGATAAWTHGIAVQAGQQGLTNLLAHEFTHVVSLRRGQRPEWWLSEGLAEYVADRAGSSTRDRLPSVRRFLQAGGWDGEVAYHGPPPGTPEDERLARLGLALLTVTCLADRFGEDRMLAFFAAVVRDESTPEWAAPALLGTDWAPVAAACSAEIRGKVN
ncbi:hypothetical protein ACFPIJ_29830 [Dactylosporangium cerinum]|uniref:Peptidase MA-like domain-containing protein n=1 Tax=Dactylosporangium cerinum TaxID=1434730 RepID=A0ABV9W1W3_9ACTN